MTFEKLADEVKRLDKRLAGWADRVANPKYFRPLMQCEYGRVFDARERAKDKLCALDPVRYAALFPNEPNDRHQ